MDTVSKDVRSKMMSGIKSKNTRPEHTVRSALHSLGYRFRLHSKILPGKPDIVLPKHRKVVLVHGCFWHGHPCKIARLPKSRLEYWIPKIERTKQRDEIALANLKEAGWEPLVVWECETRSALQSLAERLKAFMLK